MADNSTPFTNRAYLDALERRVLVFDGAMGTSLQKMNLSVEQFGGPQTAGCNDFLVLSYPQAVEQVHRSFLEAGADAIETDTFRSNRITLAEYGLQGRVTEINRRAAQLARSLAQEYSSPGQPRFVAGSIGPSGKLPSIDDPQLSDVSFDELADVFREQAAALIEGGVDLLLIETSQDILEVKAAVAGIQAAFAQTGQRLPLQVQVTLDTTGRMLLGTEARAVSAILDGLPLDVIGLNCSTGPEHMREPIQLLVENSSRPVSCIPNAGLPLNIDGQAVYPLEPDPFASMLAEFVKKHGVRVVGGCCGTTPDHIHCLVEALGPKDQPYRSNPGEALLASAVEALPMHQEPRPLLIGERLSSQGSRAFKQLLLAGEIDGILEIARSQVDGGAHALDVCVALTEQPDEAGLIRRVIKPLANAVRVPLVIDTTEPDVMEAALQTAPGRSLLNSTHLEGGPEKARKVFALARRYNAAVICLTIDESGMARTAARKVEVARRLYDLAVNEAGLKPQDLVFDALTFTLATGDSEYAASALDTLEGIRQIKAALPGVMTSLGVSNVSFGLNPPARAALNSVMLYHAVQAGLDMAIVNAAQITPYNDISPKERQLAEDLILNRRPDALVRLIRHYQQAPQEDGKRTGRSPLDELPPAGRVHWRILHRHREGIEKDLDALLDEAPQDQRPRRAVEVLNQVLLPAMKEVGDKFGSGELILPFVLQSAEVMKRAVAHLEQFLEKKEGVSKGTLVLATVYGDVHDIGKNLVKTILSNNGYRVVDLGKQVPADTIISKAVEENASAIGLSALLVSTSKQMPLIVNELHRRKLRFPVLVGGAAINQRFGRRIAQTEDGSLYEAGVFYCKDAFEGLEVMEALGDGSKRSELLGRIRREAEMEQDHPSPAPAPAGARPARSVPPAEQIPAAPFYGSRTAVMPLESVFACLSKKELFRLSWGAKNARGAEWERLRAGFEERLLAMQRQAQAEGWLDPRGLYGYWPAQASGDDLVLYEPESAAKGSAREAGRFHFPRQAEGDRLSLADYFAPVESGMMDLAVLQVVTVGAEASRRIQQLQDSGDYSEAYYTHGLSVQTAEAAAEYLHRHIRRELGLNAGQGKRYSWGYPAIPDLAGHTLVFELLPAAQKLGMQLTEAYQLVPEQSTAAIILHHPAARYFNLGESRLEQLLR